MKPQTLKKRDDLPYKKAQEKSQRHFTKEIRASEKKIRGKVIGSIKTKKAINGST